LCVWLVWFGSTCTSTSNFVTINTKSIVVSLHRNLYFSIKTKNYEFKKKWFFYRWWFYSKNIFYLETVKKRWDVWENLMFLTSITSLYMRFVSQLVDCILSCYSTLWCCCIHIYFFNISFISKMLQAFYQLIKLFKIFLSQFLESFLMQQTRVINLISFYCNSTANSFYLSSTNQPIIFFQIFPLIFQQTTVTACLLLCINISANHFCL